jgi:uncharacterized membrane protein YhaH (DUF805 family)
MTAFRVPLHVTSRFDALIPRRAFWGLFAVAGAVFILDAVLSFVAVSAVPSALEQNPIATGAMEAGLPVALGFKVLVLLQVGVTAHVLRHLQAAIAARCLFIVVTVVGAWGVGTAMALLLAV